MISDLSFWIQFVHDSDLTIDESILLQYGARLADRFSTIEELLTADENEFINLGIISQLDRVCLIRHARLSCAKEHVVLAKQFTASKPVLENCHGNLSRRKTKSNLSSALISRISCLNHPSYAEFTNGNDTCLSEQSIEVPERTVIDNTDDKIQKLIESYQTKPPRTSSQGRRTIKTFSNSILLRKKMIAGTDRLKRLTLSKSFFKRQTALMTQKVSNMTHRIINPSAKIKHKNDRTFLNHIKPAPCQIDMNDLIEQMENRKAQVSTCNNEMQASSDFIFHSHADDSTSNAHQLVPTLVNKQFKLGAPTTFLTRSLAHYDYTK
ncbi:unnamed protein product [Rotaria socialis]|uniref:Uncharacterized protein n=1 Tax=Rotaria socialis TaxID=392032 RepID=A0A818YJ26_9BILA|nr:unnamed protein product [Rotaria socialis]CAF4440894.1 unnamed protein product [Rotaria socialis]